MKSKWTTICAGLDDLNTRLKPRIPRLHFEGGQFIVERLAEAGQQDQNAIKASVE